MEPAEPAATLRRLLAPYLGKGALASDAFGSPTFVVRVDMTHLDADALNDRLAAWVAREARAVVEVSAFVSFHHARPADDADPEADFETEWRDLEATLRLDASEPAESSTLERFASLVPPFLALVASQGRPRRWRDPEMGAAE